MGVRKTLQIGDPVLRETATNVFIPITDSVQLLIADLKDTMRSENLVGLAAPQIGESLRIIVTEIRPDNWRKLASESFTTYINPQITAVSHETELDYEGCGSVASGQLFGQVQRSKEITLQYKDESGVSHETKLAGLLARVVQHEIDHLNGVLFTDLVDPKTLISRELYINQLKSKSL